MDLIYARHDVDPEAAGRRNAAHPQHRGPYRHGSALIPEAACRLIDFLLSAPVERMLAESVSHNVPVRADLAADYAQYAVPDPLRA